LGRICRSTFTSNEGPQDRPAGHFFVRIDFAVKNWCAGTGKTENTPADLPSLTLRQGIRFSKSRCARQENLMWCGRRESNPHRPFGPTDFLTNYGFRRPAFSATGAKTGLWSGLSLHLSVRLRCCPSSLYAFPETIVSRGLARDCHMKGFPEFEQFCIGGFPPSTQPIKSVASTIPPRPLAVSPINETLRSFKGIACGDRQSGLLHS